MGDFGSIFFEGSYTFTGWLTVWNIVRWSDIDTIRTMVIISRKLFETFHGWVEYDTTFLNRLFHFSHDFPNSDSNSFTFIAHDNWIATLLREVAHKC